MNEKTETKSRLSIRDMVIMALLAALICVLSPWTVPIGPVPVSFGTFAIYLTVYIAGWKRGSISVLIYLLLGFVGLPVFAGFTGGAAKLAGPTGGYLIGYIPMAILIGLVIDRFPGNNLKDRLIGLAAMLAGTWVLYLFGTLWLALVLHYTFAEALAIGVLPFLLTDFLKMVLAAVLGPILRSRISRFDRN